MKGTIGHSLVRGRVLRGSATLAAILCSLILGALPVAAQGGTCLDDVTGRVNNCTANDVQMGTLYNLETVSCTPGELVTLYLRADVVAVANERYDIGLFLALDGGDARTGTCYRDYLPPPLAGINEYNPGSPFPGPGGGPFYNGEAQDPLDLCGDLVQGVNTYHDLAPELGGITVPCIDVDGDGYLDVSGCVSWDNQTSNTCLDVYGAIPNTKAKCRCATLAVGNVIVEPGAIVVSKQPSPDSVNEPGGDVTFTFSVQNLAEGTITLDALEDSVFGDLTAYPGSTCTLPQLLAPAGQPGDTYSCAVAAFVGGPAGIHRDTVVASGVDDAGSPVSDMAAAEVLIADLLPLIQVLKSVDPQVVQEPGAQVTYSLRVTNTGGASDPVTLTALDDDNYGDVTDGANPQISATTCELVTIPPGVNYECSFRAEVLGGAGDKFIDTVTAVAVDDDGSQAQATAAAAVTIVQGPPDTGVELPAPLLAGGLAAVGALLVGAGVAMRRRGA